MKAVYHPHILQRVDEVITEAGRQGKSIKWIELTRREWLDFKDATGDTKVYAYPKQHGPIYRGTPIVLEDNKS